MSAVELDGASEIARRSRQHSDEAKTNSRRIAQIISFLLISSAIAGVMLAPAVATLLYENYGLLPANLQDEMFPTLYSEEQYRDQFGNWGLWPAGLMIGLGLLFGWYRFAPPRVFEPIFPKRHDVILWIIVIIGVLFRLRALFENRSFWLDEVLLATNLRDRGLIELLTTQLDNFQSAPPGFLTLIWLSYFAFGANETGMRLVPFVFGSAAVVIGKIASATLFRSKLAQATFISLIAFSPVLVYYSQELKQYSVDVFAVVVGIWMLSRWGELARWWRFGTVGMLLATLSLASVFALLAVGFAITMSHIKEKGVVHGIVMAVAAHWRMFLMWLLGGVLHGWYLVSAGTSTSDMRDWWSNVGGFPPSGNFLATIFYLFEGFNNLVWISLAHSSQSGPGGGGPTVITVVVLIALTLGLIVQDTGRPFAVFLMVLTILLAVSQIYPFFAGRLNLYLVPVISLILAGLVDSLRRSPKRISRNGLGLTVSAIVLLPLLVSLVVFGRAEDKHDMRWLLAEFDARHNSGDVLTSPDEIIYEWYRTAHSRDRQEFIPSERIIGEPEQWESHSVWIISTHQAPLGIVESLSQTHRVECSASPRFSSRLILVPIDAPTSSSGLCMIGQPKF